MQFFHPDQKVSIREILIFRQNIDKSEELIDHFWMRKKLNVMDKCLKSMKELE